MSNRPVDESFLVIFYKKEPLAYPTRSNVIPSVLSHSIAASV
jgi:hypothetical protein